MIYSKILAKEIMSNIDKQFIAGKKVRVKGQKSILTLTGDAMVVSGVTYCQVKERSFFIPKQQLELI